MGWPKGAKNIIWMTEEKLKNRRIYLDDGISQREHVKQEGNSKGLINNWFRKYITDGGDGL